jgi:hypothetical protein
MNSNRGYKNPFKAGPTLHGLLSPTARRTEAQLRVQTAVFPFFDRARGRHRWRWCAGGQCSSRTWPGCRRRCRRARGATSRSTAKPPAPRPACWTTTGSHRVQQQHRGCRAAAVLGHGPRLPAINNCAGGSLRRWAQLGPLRSSSSSQWRRRQSVIISIAVTAKDQHRCPTEPL